LFENMGSDGAHADLPAPTAEGRALAEVLHEIDDLVRATLGSITIATMLKIADREGKPPYTAADHCAGSASLLDLTQINPPWRKYT
jgi:hypothetical protein